MSLEFDVFDYATDTLLANLPKLEVKECRPALYEPGNGRFVMNRHDAEELVEAGVLAWGNIVKVRLTEVSETDYQWAWILEEGKWDVVSLREEAGETVEYSGRGLKALASYDIMLNHSYLTDPFIGEDPYTGLWRLGTAGTGNALGQMWWRVLREAIEAGRPYHVFPNLTIGFTTEEDSDGNAWTLFDGGFEVRIGDDLLEVAETLQTIGLVRDVTPDFVENAYESFGTDRSSSTFATGKVRLEAGVNIETGVSADVDSRNYASAVLVEGEDYTYQLVTDDDATQIRAKHFEYPHTIAPDILQRAGEGELRRVRERTDEPQVGIVPGDDETNGRYLPWKHFNYGDTVTLHTGTLESDYNEATYPIQAFRIVERPAADDSTIGDPGIDVVLELNRFVTNATRGGSPGVTVPTPVGDTLCTDVTSTFAPEDFNGDEWHPNTHWYQGGIDVNPQLGTGDQHSGAGYYRWHSLSNPWNGYVFAGTWQAGTAYTVGFWTRAQAGVLPVVIKLGAGSSGRPPTYSDSVSLTISAAESDWTYHELTWTPASTVVSDNVYTSAGVILGMTYTGTSSDTVHWDDGSVCVATAGVSIGGPGEGTVGTGGTYVPGGTVIEHGDLSGKGGTLADASQIEVTPFGTIAATNVQDALEEIVDEATGGGSGAPTDVNYLVGTASGDLSAEIVVGTTPGGELGGTWASPTVDATHSGSTHAATQAAAEATAAAALSAHTGDTSDAHDASAISIADSGGYFTGTDVEAALQELGAGGGGGGGGSLTVQEVDGSPTDSAVTKLILPNGSLAISSHEATITFPGGGGTSYALDQYALDPTYGITFDGASLPAGLTRRGLTSGNETYQVGSDGSRMRVSGNGRSPGDGYYMSVSGDGTWAMKFIPRGGYPFYGWGLGIVNTVGTGVSAGLIHNPGGHVVMATTTYTTYGGTFQTALPQFGSNISSTGWPAYFDRPVWIYLRRSSNNYYVNYSMDGDAWMIESPAQSAAITVDRIFMGFAVVSDRNNSYVELVWFNKIA